MMNEQDSSGVKGKYAPLYVHLMALKGDKWKVSFREIEEVLGFLLPRSARMYQPWWSNQNNSGSHTHAQAWQRAGWKARSVDLATETLVFERVSNSTRHTGSDPLHRSDPEIGIVGPNGEVEESTADNVVPGPKTGSAPNLFEQLTRWVMSDVYQVRLSPGKIASVSKTFDMTSNDETVVGDAKYFSMVAGERLPSAKFSVIAEHVWLLEKINASKKFLVFGNDRRVPEKWIEKYGNLAPRIAFYFLSDEGNLEVLKEQEQ